MITNHRSMTPLLVGACLTGALGLAGCTTATPPAAEPPSTIAAPTPSSETDPAEDAAQFASLTQVIDENYQSREWAGSFSGTKNDATTTTSPDGVASDATITPNGNGELTVTLPASTDPATRQIVMSLVCTGSENYWINVDQANPNRLGTTCGTDGTAIYAVPLDEPASPTTLSVTIPDDSQFWLATYYTKE